VNIDRIRKVACYHYHYIIISGVLNVDVHKSPFWFFTTTFSKRICGPKTVLEPNISKFGVDLTNVFFFSFLQSV
jgi:hypothetical protein